MPTDKRQRQRERRAERLAREASIARRRRNLRFLRRAAIVAVLVLAAGIIFSLITNDDESTTTTAAAGATTTVAGTTPDTTPDSLPATPPADYAEYREAPVACGATAPPVAQELQFVAPEDQGIAATATVTATLSTSCGDIVLALDPAAAPETVNSFVFLARQGYFDGTVSHRIAPGFVIQAGDPTATGRGGPGYTIADEYPDEGFNYGRGVVAMANAGPGTTGSQFFLVLDETGLSPAFSVFGTVVAGLDVMDRIAGDVPLTSVPPSPEVSRPQHAMYLDEVTIEVVE